MKLKRLVDPKTGKSIVILDTGDALVEVYTPEAIHNHINPKHPLEATVSEQRSAIDLHKKTIKTLENKLHAVENQRSELQLTIQKLNAETQELSHWKESGIYYTAQMIVAVIMILVIASTCLAFYLMTRPAF
ncbi:MAG: hypothetical protein O3A01_00285 [bacterium]|nr:hypothetical protein [bacterium]